MNQKQIIAIAVGGVLGGIAGTFAAYGSLQGGVSNIIWSSPAGVATGSFLGWLLYDKLF